jgi:WD40 repeat protein/energy-coupling factor transporter ATP-binding protein EcfA2
MEENYLFFGREGQSDELLLRLQDTRFIAVVGTSGSGKSSLVRAGLLPALYSGFLAGAGSKWRIAILRPVNAPLRNLAQALTNTTQDSSKGKHDSASRLADVETTLRRSSKGLIEAVRLARMPANESLLIVVDQFEELFRFKQTFVGEHPEDEANAFVKLLLEAVGQKELPIYVVLTMRSDFLGEAAQFPGLAEAINKGQYLIPRMKDVEWRQAIEGPVAVESGTITPTLVNKLLNDVGENPNQLPILQHALMRTWDYWTTVRHDSEAIDIPHYEKVGGVSEALSIHADEAYDELSSAHQLIAEKIFKSLTVRGTDNREIRRPTTVGNLCAIAEADEPDVVAVIESFRRKGRSFLMPPLPTPLTADTLIDISHESLISGWKRLKKWVEEETQSARTYQRLAQTAELYDIGDETYLQNPALQVALSWKDKVKPNKAWAEQYHPGFERAIAFLEESRLNYEKVEADKRDLLEQQLEQARAVANAQQQRAEAEEGKALAERERAETERRRVKQQKRWIFVMAALLLLMFGLTIFAFAQRREAVKQSKEAETQKGEALRQQHIAEDALVQAREAEHSATGERDKANAAKEEAVKQQGLAQAAQKEAEEQRAQAEEANSVAVEQRDKATKAEALAIEQKRKAEQSAEEARRATERANKLKIQADELAASARQQAAELAVAFKDSEVARDMAKKAQEDAEIQATRAEKEKEAADKALRTLSSVDEKTPDFAGIVRHDSPVVSASFTQDRESVQDKERVLHVLTASSGGLKLSDVKIDPVQSANSEETQDTDDEVKVTITDAVIKDSGNGFVINSAVMSPDGNLVLAACDDNKVRVWSASDGSDYATLVGHEGPVTRVSFSRRGKYIVTASADKTARIWETKNLTRTNDGKAGPAAIGESVSALHVLRHDNAVTLAVFSADEKWLATASAGSKTVLVWNIEDPNQTPVTLDGHTSAAVKSIAFSPADKDGQVLHQRLATTAEGDKRAEIWEWDGTKWKHAHTLAGHRCQVNSVEFSHDGTSIVTASDDGSAFVWDAGNGKLSHELRGYKGLLLSRTHRGTRSMFLGAISGGRLSPFPFALDLQPKEGEFVPMNTAKFSHDDKKIVTASVDGKVRVWGIETGIKAFKVRDKPQVLQGFSRNASSADFSPYDEYVLAASDDGSARVWEVRKLKIEVPKQCLTPKQKTDMAEGKKFNPASAKKKKAL